MSKRNTASFLVGNGYMTQGEKDTKEAAMRAPKAGGRSPWGKIQDVKAVVMEMCRRHTRLLEAQNEA